MYRCVHCGFRLNQSCNDESVEFQISVLLWLDGKAVSFHELVLQVSLKEIKLLVGWFGFSI